MEKIVLHDKTFVPYISNARIESAIDGVAEKLNRDFQGCAQPPVFLCVLNGAIMFTASLMRRLEFPMELCSLKLSSYVGTSSTGKVQATSAIPSCVKGRTVIVCEDIVDTGNTIVALKEMLLESGATEVRICTMLLKPAMYSKNVPLDYVGMEIPNDFIVGYGLDYNELGRNHKDIFVLEK